MERRWQCHRRLPFCGIVSGASCARRPLVLLAKRYRAYVAVHIGEGGLRRWAGETESMGRLDGRVALVTGAASGIGLAISQLFAEEGARVFLADINAAGAEAAAAALVENGHPATPLSVDVSRGPDVVEMFRTIAASVGKLD